jgi:hypothetical protein
MKQIVCGDGHTCALSDDGQIFCWGAGGDPMLNAMALANPGNMGLFAQQGQAIPPTGTFKQISAGGLHNCAIDMSDGIVCWGAGTKEKMNDMQPNFGQSLAPLNVSFKQVSCGQVHTCAVTTKGEAVCWGAGGDNVDCHPPGHYDCGQAGPPFGTFLEVASGDMHTCGLLEDGTLQCWGRGTDMSNCDVLSGTNAYDCGQANPPAAMMPYIKVRSGWEYSCALHDDYTIKCWGWNGYGQLQPPPRATLTQMSLGDTHGCGLQVRGTYACWGQANAKATEVPPGIP